MQFICGVLRLSCILALKSINTAMKVHEILREAQLTELFDTTYDWKWDDDRGIVANMIGSKIDVPGQEYAPSKLRAKFKNLAATFELEGGDTIWVMFLNSDAGQWEIVFDSQENKLDKEKSFADTGAGNASKVLATVLEIVKTFVDKYHPTAIQFTAKDRKRTAIYTALARQFKNYKDYQYRAGKNAEGDTVFAFWNY